MLNENIKQYRKAKGFSQETLAQELNVVRQTVSKWEKGISVPDAEMLTKISEVLEVSVMTLLGGNEQELTEKTDNSAIANQLYILNNQFAKELYRRRKVRKTVLIVLLCIFVILPFLGAVIYMPRTVEGTNAECSVIEVESDIFSQLEIDAAINCVVDTFNDNFKGCRLEELSYAGDDIVRKETKYYGDSISEGDIILIKTVFYVSKNGGDGSLNTDYTYTDWYWILGRTESGHWTELDHGIL